MRQMFFVKGTKEMKVAVNAMGAVSVRRLPIQEDRLTHARREFYRIFSTQSSPM
ncbi:MAG TPA: hypothetical protein H9662_05095 [Firmicutes bacterium]|nr:hypothetical protein [Bacillota bacterium]